MEVAPKPSPSSKPVIVGIVIFKNRVVAFPERVVVQVGQDIAWVVLASDSDEFRMLEIYFPSDSPFEWHESFMKFDPTQRGRPPFGAIEQPRISAQPESPGDYKYGVRLRDAAGTTLDDEDPYITVVSRM